MWITSLSERARLSRRERDHSPPRSFPPRRPEGLIARSLSPHASCTTARGNGRHGCCRRPARTSSAVCRCSTVMFGLSRMKPAEQQILPKKGPRGQRAGNRSSNSEPVGPVAPCGAREPRARTQQAAGSPTTATERTPVSGRRPCGMYPTSTNTAQRGLRTRTGAADEHAHQSPHPLAGEGGGRGQEMERKGLEPSTPSLRTKCSPG